MSLQLVLGVAVGVEDDWEGRPWRWVVDGETPLLIVLPKSVSLEVVGGVSALATTHILGAAFCRLSWEFSRLKYFNYDEQFWAKIDFVLCSSLQRNRQMSHHLLPFDRQFRLEIRGYYFEIFCFVFQ